MLGPLIDVLVNQVISTHHHVDSVPTDKVATVLGEADGVLRDMKSKPLSADEFADVKLRRERVFATRFESTAETAWAFSWPLLYRQPENALAETPARIASVSADDAQAAAARYLDPERVRFVIVGDWATLRPSLESLGWGPVELRNADGSVAKPVRGAHAVP